LEISPEQENDVLAAVQNSASHLACAMIFRQVQSGNNHLHEKK